RRRRRLGFPRGRGRAARGRGSAAWGRAALRRRPGLARPSGLLGRHARAHARRCAPRVRPLPHGRRDGDRGLSRSPAALAARADLRVGVSDDHPKISPEIAGRFYDAMKDVGLTENRISVTWDPSRPATIPNLEAIQQATALAATHDVHVTLTIYPDRARALTGSPTAAQQFVSFVQLVARTFPEVKDFIVGNEPNKSRFWQPQFNRN